ncbi:hypothetical protein ARMGADRAFT_1088919 [Armillaria gallica]|uniref:Cyclic nucleotide-binding domain-containing protein n=1 Tax=Armillaria gallica TaxID=47427 RepID=A0A2H3CXN4_ARMGA|nr:hypothetical protein ARMGADRAFT_1088919 [Armillaria gallica]
MNVFPSADWKAATRIQFFSRGFLLGKSQRTRPEPLDLGSTKVEAFDTFGNAMEWTENVYLKAWLCWTHNDDLVLPGRQDADTTDYSESGLGLSMLGSLRIVHLYDAGSWTIANKLYPSTPPSHDQASIPSLSLGGTPPRLPRETMSGRDHGRLTPPLEYHLLFTSPQREPLLTLSRALSSYTSLDLSLLPTCVCYPAGHVLWQQIDPPDGLYVIEKGILQMSYAFESWGLNMGLESFDINMCKDPTGKVHDALLCRRYPD